MFTMSSIGCGTSSGGCHSTGGAEVERSQLVEDDRADLWLAQRVVFVLLLLDGFGWRGWLAPLGTGQVLRKGHPGGRKQLRLKVCVLRGRQFR